MLHRKYDSMFTPVYVGVQFYENVCSNNSIGSSIPGTCSFNTRQGLFARTAEKAWEETMVDRCYCRLHKQCHHARQPSWQDLNTVSQNSLLITHS